MKTLTGDILIVAAELGSTSLQETQEGDDISSGYDCLHPTFPSAGPLFYLCVCVVAVALPPEKTDSCCVEEKMQERDGQSTAGKQLQFEVSVPSSLPHTLTHTLLQTNLALFQELECAVSVEEDNRQEWTFTLYDFDNNGKVTREVMREYLLSTRPNKLDKPTTNSCKQCRIWSEKYSIPDTYLTTHIK